MDYKTISERGAEAAEQQKNLMDQRREIQDRYQIKLTDDQYQSFSSYIANAENAEEAENNAYRIACALKYSEIYDISPEEAFLNLDNLNSANFGDVAILPKTNFRAIVDSLQQGFNQASRNNLGIQIRDAEENGRDATQLYEDLEYLDRDTESLEDYQNRNWFINCVKYGAQSTPFTGQAIIAGGIGAILGGGIGARALSTLSSWEAMRGEEYLQLRKDGASVETAGRISDTVALASAIVETALGEVIAGVGTVAGKAVSGTISKQVIDKVTKDVVKNMYYGGGWKRAAAIAMKTGAVYLAEASEEGLEEVLQELISSFGRSVSASIDKYEKDPKIRAELGQRVAESFKGGFCGALVLGVGNALSNANATVKEYKSLEELAVLTEHADEFKEASKDSPVFSGMTDEQREEFQEEIHKKAEPARERRREDERKAALATAETIDVGERTEETVENEAAQVVRDDEYRTAEGKLNYSDRVIEHNDNGTTDNEYLVKGKGKEEYGRIIYNVDGDNVTITDFTLSPTRENLRQEVYTDFAEKFAGKNIEWETRSEEANAVKQSLIDQNTRGSKNGLNYFESTKSSRNQRARVSIMQEIKAARPSATNEELITDLAMVESRAAFQGKSIADLYEEKGSIVRSFMTDSEREKTISYLMEEGLSREDAEKKVDTDIGGFFSGKDYDTTRRGFIYLSKKSNPQTFMHEYMHSIRHDFSQDENERAAKAIGVKDVNNWTREEEEKLVDYFTKWAIEGKTEKQELVPIFQKIANALAALYNNIVGKIEMSQEIVDFFDSLFDDPTNALAQARAALTQMDQKAYEQEKTSVEQKEDEDIISDESLLYVDRTSAAMDSCGDLMLQLIPEMYARNIGKGEDIENAKRDYENGVSLEKIYDTYHVVLSNTGEWMYETDDRKFAINEDVGIDSSLAYMQKDISNLQKFYNLIKQGVNIEKAELGYEQQMQLLDEKIKVLNEDYKTMGDLYDAGELYEANPELKDLRVGFFQSPVNMKSVMVDGGIAFNVYHIRDIDTLKGSIAYEFQLALQKGISTNVESAKYWNAVADAIRSIDSNKYSYDFMDNIEILKEMAEDPYNLDAAAARDRVNMNRFERRANAEIKRGKPKGLNYKENVSDDGPLLFQKLSEEDVHIANKYLSTKVDLEERTRIQQNINRFNGTPFYEQLMQSLAIRYDAEELVLNGKEPRPNSMLWRAGKNVVKYLRAGETGLWAYLQYKGALSHPSKAVFSVPGSVVECSPSDGCARYCYVCKAGSNYHYAAPMVKAELMQMAINFDPVKAARLISKQYKNSTSYTVKEYLRLNDQGDLSPKHLPFIKELNRLEITTSVFSKKGDLLSQVDPRKNVIQLSIDSTNLDLAEKYKNLPYAYVWDGTEDGTKFLLDKQDHFEKNGGVILPVVLGRKFVTEDKLSIIKSAVPWAWNKYICPIDAGRVKINPKDPDRMPWNCRTCDILGYGCAYGRGVNERLQRETFTSLNKVSVGVFNESTAEVESIVLAQLQEQLSGSPELLRALKSGITQQLADYRRKKLSGYDLEGEAGYYRSLSEAAAEGRGGLDSSGEAARDNGSGVDAPLLQDLSKIREQYEGTDQWMKAPNGNLLFQYLQNDLDRETIEEAASFDTWEEWYSFAQTMDDEGVVTGAWDAVAEKEWFRNAWEYAKKIYGSKSDKATEQSTEPLEDLDKKFIDKMIEPGAIEDFVERIRQYNKMAAGLSNPLDEQEAAEFDTIIANSDFINEQLLDIVWQSESINDTKRKKIMSLIEDAPKVYRGIYSDVYNDPEMSVPITERTKVDTFLDLPEDQIIKMDRMTPSQRRDLVKELEDEEIKNQILNGTYKMDGSIDRAIDVAGDEIKKLQAEIEALNEEYKDALDNIKNQQKKDFVEEYNRLLEMYDQLNNKNLGSITQALEAGKIGSSDASTAGKQGQIQDIQRRMDHLKTLLKGERDAIEAIEKAKAKSEYQQQLKDKLKQRAIKAEVRRMRNGLVKSITRKVSFHHVYYDDAKQIIAAQDFMNDWLTSGVNQWISKETPFLRKVYSEYITDEGKRKEIIDALSNSKYRSKADKAIQLLEGARTGKGKVYNDWTAEERKILHVALGRTDWTNTLNLESKDKYRREVMHGAYNADGSMTDEAMALVEKILPPEMIANIQYKPMVGWTLEEMEALAKIIDDKYTEGKKVLAGMQQQRRNEIESIRDQIEKVVKDTGIVINPDDPEEEKRKKAEKIRKILGMRTQVKGTAASAAEKASLKDRFMAIDRGTGNARRFARVMDNYGEGVFTTTLCFREYMAYDDEMKHLNDRTKYVQKWMKDNGLSVDDLQKQHVFKGLMNGEDMLLSTDDLLYIYVADQDDMSRAAVMYGNFGTAEEKQEGKRRDDAIDYSGTNWFTHNAEARYQEVLSYAKKMIDESDKLKGFVDLIERDYEAQYDRLNEASITVFNTPVNRVQSYVPLYRREMSGEENEKQVMHDIMADTTGAPSSYVGRGMTINRVKIYPLNQTPVQLGLYKTWADSSAKTEHFIAYGGYVRDLNAIFTSPSSAATREVIASRYGDDANSYIKNYINELANPSKGQQRETVDRIVHVLRGKAAPAYLSWKASGIIKQLCTSPWPFMTYVSPASYLSSLGKFIVPGNNMSEIVKEKSVYMANRTIDPIIDLIREAEQKADGKAKYLFAQINSTGMQGLEWADWISVAPGWYASYENEKAQLNKQNSGKTEVNDDYLTDEEIEKKAVAKADDIVRLTQPSGRKADIAPLFKTSSEVAKIILQFQTALNVIYQQIRFDIPYQIHNKQYGQVVRTIIGYTMAGIVVNGVVSGFGGDDDDDKDKLRKSVFYATTQFTDAVPVVGSQLTNIVEKAVTGKGQYSNSNLFPVLETLKKTTNELSDGDFRTAAELFGQGVAYSLGLPVSGYKEVKALLGIGDDDGTIEVHPEALWGRR